MANTEKIELLKRRSFGEVVSDAFTFIRLNLGVIIKTQLLISLPAILVIAACFLLLFRDYFSLLIAIQSGPFSDLVSLAESFDRGLVSMLFTMLASMPVSITTFAIMDAYSRQQDGKLKFEDVLAVLKSKGLSLLALKFIIAIALGVLSIFLVFPALLFYTFFSFSELLVLQHSYPVNKALSHSYNVTYKVFWQLFGTQMLFFLVYYLFGLLMGLPVSLLENFAGFATGTIDLDSPLTLVAMALRTFNTILSYVIYAIPTVVIGIQYFSVREQLSKGRLMERIKGIGLPKTKEKAYYVGDEHY